MESNYYHVRISNKKNPKNDFNIFLDDIKLRNESIWDKDHYNKIKINDYIGFIIGSSGKEKVLIFKVLSETNRENHWEQNRPYTIGNGIHEVKKRHGIILTDIHEIIKEIEWKKIKKDINFAPNNDSCMPRGMQRVKNKELLPFDI